LQDGCSIGKDLEGRDCGVNEEYPGICVGLRKSMKYFRIAGVPAEV
jgi:hypothetical protein